MLIFLTFKKTKMKILLKRILYLYLEFELQMYFKYLEDFFCGCKIDNKFDLSFVDGHFLFVSGLIVL